MRSLLRPVLHYGGMMLQNRKFVIGAIAVVAAILIIGGAVFAFVSLTKQEVSTGDPVDIVFDFYKPWLAAAQSTTTDPYAEGLAKWPLLGKDLRAKIRDAQRTEGAVDPVLCQTDVPENFSMRIVHTSEETTEILVMARRSASPEQAIVTLNALNGGWYIHDIRCTPGEVAPEREFSFDTEGRILKSVPPPLNSEYWHLVFEENGQPGHHAPLFFSPESICVAMDGTPGTCDLSIFMEAAKARVQGQMTELGVNVVRLQFVR